MMQSLLLIRAILRSCLKFSLLCYQQCQLLLLFSSLSFFMEHPQSPGQVIPGVVE